MRKSSRRRPSMILCLSVIIGIKYCVPRFAAQMPACWVRTSASSARQLITRRVSQLLRMQRRAALSDNMSVIVWQMKRRVLINQSDPYLKPNRRNTWACKFSSNGCHKFKSRHLQFNNRVRQLQVGATICFNVKDSFGIPSVCLLPSIRANVSARLAPPFLFFDYILIEQSAVQVQTEACVFVAGWQAAVVVGGVNLPAAVSVLITTDVCCKRTAAGNKDTTVSAAVPWCDSIRQEDAYWQGEKGGWTERDRDGGGVSRWGRGAAISPGVSHLGTDAMSRKSTPSFLRTAQEHYLNSSLYQGPECHRKGICRRTWRKN